MPDLFWPAVAPWLLLLCSNLFMTFAWYGHLKFRHAPLALVILISWMIAGFEYIFAVPANRIGASFYTAAQLKAIQEVITLSVFVIFSWLYLGQAIKWTTIVGFMMIFAGAGLIFFKGLS